MDPVEPHPAPELELEANPARTYALLGLATLAGLSVLVLVVRGARRRVAPLAAAPGPLDLDDLEELSPALRTSFEHLTAGIEQRLAGPLEKVTELEELVGRLRVEVAAVTPAAQPIPRDQSEPLATPAPAAVSTNGAELPVLEHPAADLEDELELAGVEPGGDPTRTPGIR